jgi:hypothetical protein
VPVGGRAHREHDDEGGNGHHESAGGEQQRQGGGGAGDEGLARRSGRDRAHGLLRGELVQVLVARPAVQDAARAAGGNALDVSDARVVAQRRPEEAELGDRVLDLAADGLDRLDVLLGAGGDAARILLPASSQGFQGAEIIGLRGGLYK